MSQLRNRLTDAYISRADLKNGRHADGGNLYLHVSDRGRSWVFYYRSPTHKNNRDVGRLREMGLGSQINGDVVSLAVARKLAEQMRRKVALGIDPLDDKTDLKSSRQEVVF